MITIKNYVKASGPEEAWELLQKPSARILGGMMWLRLGNGTVGTAIDLSGLGLDSIEETPEAYRVGAMVSLRTLEKHPGLQALSGGALASALGGIVGVQFRNMATVGGSVFARLGFSDVLTMLMAMGCSVELYKGGVLPLEEFAAAPFEKDILLRVIVPKTPARYCYQSVRAVKTDLPILTCAAALGENGWTFVYGARPGRALCLRDEKGLLSGGITAESAADFARYAGETVVTGSNSRGSREYRSHLVEVLTERAIRTLGGLLT